MVLFSSSVIGLGCATEGIVPLMMLFGQINAVPGLPLKSRELQQQHEGDKRGPRSKSKPPFAGIKRPVEQRSRPLGPDIGPPARFKDAMFGGSKGRSGGWLC